MTFSRGAFRARCTIAALAMISSATPAKADIQPGDIAIIGLNADDPDQTAFVALNTIPAGEVIRFTDSGWQSGGGFRATEGGIQFTVATDLLPGTVVDRTTPFTAGGWSVNNAGVGTSGFALATSGDQILAFQGDAAAPVFIYALNVRSNWGNATSSNTSALPAGLTDGVNAVAITGANENAYYSGPTEGTPEEILAAISNAANWTKSSTRLTFPAWVFTISGGGDPTGACFYEDFSCARVTEAACIDGGGTYQGNGTSCPAPTGACCEGQFCSGGITQNECVGVGGVYRGDDTTCDGNICDLTSGACCLQDDTCVSGQTAFDCCSLNGVFRGQGTVCGTHGCAGVVTLNAVHSLATGQNVTLKQVIVTTTTDLVANTGSKSITVQDYSGAGGETRGYNVFGTNAVIDAILAEAQAGSILVVSGQTASFNGLAQLTATSTGIQVCGQTTAPAPVAVTIQEVQDGNPRAEELESALITLACVNFVDAGGTFAGGTSYTATDSGSGLSVVIRVQTPDLDLAGQTIPAGPVTITGVLSQFDNSSPFDGGYQIMPISFSAIEACAVETGACCVVDSPVNGCPTCAGDMDGNGVVNVNDVADFVAALLGESLANPGGAACGNVDGDVNGLIDGSDVEVFVGRVLAQTVCASCSTETASDCTNFGGSFAGLGTTCGSNPCNP